MSELNLRVRLPEVTLVVVAVFYVVAALMLADTNRFLAWDEAVYFAEVSPSASAIHLSAHRARGVTFLVAPLLQLSGSIEGMRIYLGVLSAFGLYLTFLPWCRIAGLAAPLGAMVFASTWASLFYATELMPNLFSALGALAAIGFTINFATGGRRSSLLGLIAAVTFTTLVRPIDGAVLLAVVCFVAVIKRGAHTRATLLAATAAAVGAVLPWFIEGAFRFGGPLERLRRARELTGSGPTNNIETYLQMLAAPTGTGTTATTAGSVAVWLVVLLVLAVAGIVMSTDRRLTSGITLVVSAAFAAPYLFYSEAAAPRFLLPALGFLSLAAGIGLLNIVEAVRPQWAGWCFVGVGLIGLITWQIQVLGPFLDFQNRNRQNILKVAEVIDETARPCFFLSNSGHPQLAVATGCRGGPLSKDSDANLDQLAERRAAGNTVYALVLSNQPHVFLDTTWSCSKIESLASTSWHLCLDPAT